MDSDLPNETDHLPTSPSPPFLIQPPPEDIEIDLDLGPDRPLSRASSTTSSINNWNDIDELLSASRNSGFLSPDAASTLRRPSSRMSDSGSMDAASVAAAQAASPFNFETQFMASAPVKSVSTSRLLENICQYIGLTGNRTEHRTATWPPLQTLLHQRPTSDLPGASSPPAPRTACFSSRSDSKGSMGIDAQGAACPAILVRMPLHSCGLCLLQRCW